MGNRFNDQRVLKKFMKQLHHRKKQTQSALIKYKQLLDDLNKDELTTLILYLASKEDDLKKWVKRFRFIIQVVIVMMMAVIFVLQQGEYVNVDHLYAISFYGSLGTVSVVGLTWFSVFRSQINLRIFKGVAIHIVEERRKNSV